MLQATKSRYDPDMLKEELNMHHIDFTFLTNDEVKNIAVCEITEAELEGPGSLYDLRMGPTNTNEICSTCN